MRRTSRFSRTACLGFFVAALVAHGACANNDPSDDPGEDAGHDDLANLEAKATLPLIESARQCSDDSFDIDLSEMQNANLGQDTEERTEQLRDWLWQLLLARLEATTRLEGLLVGSVTQPLIRDDALAHVLDLPVGDTRAGTARDGTVVVMVQDADEAAMQEAVLEAIDQEMLHLGRAPRQAIVYRYAIDERAGYVNMCPFGTFDADWIESQSQGFRHATVRTVRELEAFLDGGMDLMSAQCTPLGLAVTGRARPRARLAPITVEHVASLAPRPITSYVPLAELGGYPSLPPEQAESVRTMATLLQHSSTQDLAEIREHADHETAEMAERVLSWRTQHPYVPTEHLVLSWMMQYGGGSIGFSLDPRVRAGEAVKNLKALREVLHDPAALAALLHAWNAAPTKAAALVQFQEQLGALPASSEERLLALEQELAASADHETLGVLMKALYQDDPIGSMFVAPIAGFVKDHSAYQCARYDGPLQGTLTGMTMFYTDLLMKLWDSDHFDSAPDGLIPGFESVVGHELSSAYCTEEETRYPVTRAWLGLREEQYVRQEADRVRFAPVVTRVFARGSEYGAEYGEEVEASADSRRFYRWWSAHYARVAAWEPQYELLNQIMKWSVITQAAALSEHEDCLEFLDEVPVDRSQRFDQWVAKHEALRWRGPVPLLERDDEPTECLPLLRSRAFTSCGSKHYFVGGVSAASKAVVASKPVMGTTSAPQLARLKAMSSNTSSVSRGGRFKYASITRPDGKLHEVEIDPATRSFQARIDTGQSQRGTRHHYARDHLGEQQLVTGLKNERSLQQHTLTASDMLDAHDSTLGVAHLHAGDVTGAKLRPQVTPGPATRMRSIGETAAARLADGKLSLSDVAPDLPGVTNAYRLPDGTVLVEMRVSAGGGAPRFGIMSSGEGNRGPPGLLTGRFGGPGNQGAKGTVEVTLISDRAAQPMLAQATKLPSRQQDLLIHVTHTADAQDLPKGEQAIAHHLAQGGDRASVQGALAQAHRGAVRQGRDIRGIEALQLRTSIKYGKPRAPARERSVFPADGTDFLVPRSHARRYADIANLPPGQNPALRSGAPRPAFAARVVAESSMVSDVPSVVRVDGVEYVHMQRPGMTPGTARLVYVIEPCRREGKDEGRGTVECQGRTTAQRAEETQRQYLRRIACRSRTQAKAFGLTGCGKSTRP